MLLHCVELEVRQEGEGCGTFERSLSSSALCPFSLAHPANKAAESRPRDIAEEFVFSDQLSSYSEEKINMEWPTYLDEYQKLVLGMNNPRVAIDNVVCQSATLVKVDSASRKHSVLLEAMEVLADLNLSIKKAYISSDGRWFMDVFHVTDQFGRKLTDDSVISYLEQSLDAGNREPSEAARGGCRGLTTLELTGGDRPGLLSEVFAVLADLYCAVAEATVWTHNGRIACVLLVKDQISGSPIEDPPRIHRVESRLRHVLKCDNDVRGVKIAVSSTAVANVDRRLHQLMLTDRDYERASSPPSASPTAVLVQNWVERGYSVVNVQCRDRPKLLFDIVCTLTDMEYVVFHGTVDTDGDLAEQEFYIRHKDGSPINSEAERQRVILCLQAAIERRAAERTRLELCMPDRPALLSDVTRTFRENGLLVTRAEVSTKGDMASDVFYVTGAGGQPADPQAIEAVRASVGPECLKVKEEQRPRFCRKDSIGQDTQPQGGVGIGLLYLGSLVWRNLYNLGLIKSCS